MNETAELKIKLLLSERQKLAVKADNLLDQIKKIDEKIKRIKEFENSRNSRSQSPASPSRPADNPSLQPTNIFNGR